MLQFMEKYIDDLSTFSMPPYRLFVDEQLNFVHDRYTRFFNSLGHESRGMRLLRYPLQLVDMEYMASQVNNFDRYMNHVRHIHRDVSRLLKSWMDERDNRMDYIFIRSGYGSTKEFVYSTDDTSAITTLPLWSENWNDWKNVRCFYCIDHDSEEFNVNIVNDYIHFKSLAPSYAIFMIDTNALVLKYYMWYTQQKDNEISDEYAKHIPQQLFLNKYAFCGVVYDLLLIWLIQNFNRLLYLNNFEDVAQFDYNALMEDRMYGRVAVTSRKAYEYLYKTINSGGERLIPKRVLNLKLFGDYSFNDLVWYRKRMFDLPPLRQYDYLKWIRDRRLLSIFIKVYENRNDLPSTKTMFKYLREKLFRLRNKRFWNNCKNPIVRNIIETDLNEFENIALDN